MSGGFFERIKAGLSKTRNLVRGSLDELLGGQRRIDAALLEEVEELLVSADFGLKTAHDIIQAVERRRHREGIADAVALRRALAQEVQARLLAIAQESLRFAGTSPTVLLIVGVNGVGKTTSVGKLAHYYGSMGKRVVLGAGDTFRAAAAEQLVIWGVRAGVEVIRHEAGSDPAAVAFDAAKAAVARRADLLIIDTAGRLHNKVNLMEELKKVHRVLSREIPGAPHETFLVLDATTGQNALAQAKIFCEAVAVSGIILTKLDGTARGGIIVAIAGELGVPVRFVGLGEGLDDLRPFDPEAFTQTLFGPE
ncbi:MAG: signal recognition particle-docking protein FtsY [Desulfuromonadales bacterium GWC2_61_20]|nr:MAG: signal recognition particle-docking protein FtsY [Desulfuromonadales bacterium GWC2_61_20]HAD05203.1 signal recognition particle-docking protein FtsY [Desulfuromonas sp.]HBT83476.1 signal recognition particle-docking protein FtsY [Desulfuromonas sp.]